MKKTPTINPGRSDMQIIPIDADQSLIELLNRAGLATSDINQPGSICFFGCHQSGKLIGSVGIEIRKKSAMLRSLATHEEVRNTGLGRALVEHAELNASHMGVSDIYLLTTTAADFFERLGYEQLCREQAPDAIRKTTQFSDLCPTTSNLMRKVL
ncbi:arsenic resistance N-acetyltransferase ArsN2 [Marinobacter nauticus]|uniref:arsenic resistance N-acetyltransferase ArsN2 n=1 Tax=Marinobacter nauticus TaxID=2743 RepID=UPI001C99E29F|nr:arsenic resistance N-acetyltransferase ArsN2 [Marinobacter nauticus]MBY5938115.1 GNAT family N-acetyltransferase [Marinobacter nauticus]MBY5955344.1 GNAT family N-acetyltransferase [Marinobacter nauticus]MBY6009135.1 GNAT family N-acetyltransferase [Marinobacter nauticus]